MTDPAPTPPGPSQTAHQLLGAARATGRLAADIAMLAGCEHERPSDTPHTSELLRVQRRLLAQQLVMVAALIDPESEDQ